MSVKTIHRFWAGGDMPSEYEKYGQQWQNMNPDWTVIDWNEPSVLVRMPRDLLAVVEDLYKRDDGQLGIELYVQMADIVGYWLVWAFGGAYFNCDMQPLQPLEGLLPDSPWASKENHTDDRIVNAAIGAPEPHHSFWTGLLDELPFRYFSDPTAEMVQSTGPQLLTDFAHQHPGQLHVFPTETFNPIHWSSIPSGGDASDFLYPPESIAVHHWGHKKDGRSNHVETGTQR